MDVLEAHGRFGMRRDGGYGLLPACSKWREVIAPAIATAACSLSGMLDDCKTDQDLEEAMEHFASLWSAEILGPDDINSETANVIRAVMDDPVSRQLDTASN